MIGILTALLSGALMSVQGVFNTQVTKATSLWVSTSFVQFTALLVCLVIWYFADGKSFMTLTQVPDKWTLLGGVIGAFITYTVIIGMNQLGPARAVMLIVAAQLIAAYLIELFGMFGVEKAGFDWLKLLGTALFLAGIIIFKKN